MINEETAGANSTRSNSFDERRVLMLKCQVYQLEKQVVDLLLKPNLVI